MYNQTNLNNAEALANDTRPRIAESFFKRFCTAIASAGKGYDTSGIKLEERTPEKSAPYNVISAYGYVLFKIAGKKVINISINPVLKPTFLKYRVEFKSTKGKKDSSAWEKLQSNEFDISPSLAVEAFEAILKQDGFDCCSRYEECSNAGHCIHTNTMFAMQCTYRRKLHAGLIYYGKNAMFKNKI